MRIRRSTLRGLIVPAIVTVLSAVVLFFGWQYAAQEQRSADDSAREAANEAAQARREAAMQGGESVIPAPQAMRTPDDERVTDLTDIARQLEVWRAERGGYPPQTGSGESLRVSPETAPCVYFASAGITDECPEDPLAPVRMYRYTSDGAHYQLTALLDDQTDERCEPLDDGICIFRIEDGEVTSGQ
jgi:hypothetical protein